MRDGKKVLQSMAAVSYARLKSECRVVAKQSNAGAFKSEGGL